MDRRVFRSAVWFKMLRPEKYRRISSLMTFVSQPVLLLAAARLVGAGHCNEKRKPAKRPDTIAWRVGLFSIGGPGRIEQLKLSQ